MAAKMKVIRVVDLIDPIPYPEIGYDGIVLMRELFAADSEKHSIVVVPYMEMVRIMRMKG